MHACLARGMHGAWRGRWAFLLRQGAAHLGGVEGEVLHDMRHAALVLLLRHAAHAHLPAPSRLTLSAPYSVTSHACAAHAQQCSSEARSGVRARVPQCHKQCALAGPSRCVSLHHAGRLCFSKHVPRPLAAELGA